MTCYLSQNMNTVDLSVSQNIIMFLVREKAIRNNSLLATVIKYSPCQ